jgi:hypothetical protein
MNMKNLQPDVVVNGRAAVAGSKVGAFCDNPPHRANGGAIPAVGKL